VISQQSTSTVAERDAWAQPHAFQPRARAWIVVAISGAIWVGAFGLMIALLLTGHLEAIPYGVYEAAGRRWLASQPLYETVTIDGFQYFPQSAMLFAPFTWLGPIAGAVTWRALGWLLYALGIWRMSRHLLPARAHTGFLLTSCLVIVCATGSLGNGQANLALAALTLHATADLIECRFWRASAVLVLGFALKPLMVVMLLLALALYPPASWRIVCLVAVTALTPWLFRDSTYVLTQYSECLTKLGMCATPNRQFEDVRGLLTILGWSMSFAIYLLARMVAALCVLASCFWARWRAREPLGTFLIAAIASCYLMLFNPRTLSTSYVMTVSSAALLAVSYAFQRRKLATLTLVAIILCWSVSYHVLPWIAHWLKPLACIVFLLVLARELRATTLERGIA
jgi:alpha-1,2-mannosyltransferase